MPAGLLQEARGRPDGDLHLPQPQSHLTMNIPCIHIRSYSLLWNVTNHLCTYNAVQKYWLQKSGMWGGGLQRPMSSKTMRDPDWHQGQMHLNLHGSGPNLDITVDPLLHLSFYSSILRIKTVGIQWIPLTVLLMPQHQGREMDVIQPKQKSPGIMDSKNIHLQFPDTSVATCVPAVAVVQSEPTSIGSMQWNDSIPHFLGFFWGGGVE